MKVIKIVKSEKTYHSIIYNDLVTEFIDETSFKDLYELNFYLQTLQKKLEFEDILLIIHDKINNSVDLKRSTKTFFLNDKSFINKSQI